MKTVTGNTTTITATFSTAAGVPVDADATPTVDVTSDAGQTVVVSAVSDTGTGTYAATLDPLDDPDLLTVTWTGEVAGATVVQTDTVEVAGGVYLSVAELLAIADLDTTRHPLARRIELRDEFEDLAERWTDQAWVPRYARDRLAYSTHLLTRRATRSLVAVTDGEDVAVDFDDWTLEPWGLITSSFGTPVLSGTWPYTVRYLHGADRPPVDLKDACREYVRAECLSAGNRRGRDTLRQTDPSGITEQFSTPDWNAGRPTGYLKIDRVLNSLGAPMPGIA